MIAENQLSFVQTDFTSSDNYRKACRFGGSDVEKRLFGYYQQGLYHRAIDALNIAQTPEQCISAQNLFVALGNYADSVQKLEECKQKVLQIRYDAALTAMNRPHPSESTFRTVQQLFIALGDFRDSAQKAEECAQKIAKIREQEEYDRKLNSYLTAEKMMKNGTQHDLEEAADKFHSLSGFKDADELREQCLAKIQEIKSQEEQEQQKRQEAEVKAAANRKKITIIGAASTATVAALALVTVFVIVPNVKYSKANGMLESGNYAAAEQAFSALGNFKDSADKVKESLGMIRDTITSVSLNVGSSHTVGLKSDGTVVAVGGNSWHQCDVSDWKDIKTSN